MTVTMSELTGLFIGTFVVACFALFDRKTSHSDASKQ